ncbi:hypothetical protein EC991_002492 [Linnemannia zychae]|nr:hypothetical protein EC991_002492 [Linnemannia zychae]
MNNRRDTEDPETVSEVGGPATSKGVPGTIPNSKTHTTTTTTDADTAPRMTKRLTLTESQKYEVCAYMRDQEEAAAAAAATSNNDGSHASYNSTQPGKSNSHHLTNKAIALYIESKYHLKVNESTVSRLRAQSATRLSKGVVNPALKRHRAVMFPELENRLGEYVVEQAAAAQATRGSEGSSERDDESQEPSSSSASSVTGLTDIAILTRARELARELGIENGQLAFSDGWLFKFKARHGMKPGGALASSVAAATSAAVASGTGTAAGRAKARTSAAAAAAAAAAGRSMSPPPPPVPTAASGSGSSSSTSASAIPQQQQRQNTAKGTSRSPRAKRQKIDRSSHAEETGAVESLDIEGINIEEQEAAAASAAPKTRRRYTRRGGAEEDTTMTTTAEEAVDNGSGQTGVVHSVSSRGRRPKSASSSTSGTTPARAAAAASGSRSVGSSAAVSAATAIQRKDGEQPLLNMGGDMDMDSHMDIEPDVDVADLSDTSVMDEDLSGSTSLPPPPHQQQQVHPAGTAGRGLSGVVGGASAAVVSQMDMSKVYPPSVAMTAVEQQQQQRQQQSRSRSTRHQQQQQQQQVAANDLFPGAMFAAAKSHKSAVPSHTSTVPAQSSLQDQTGHPITSASTAMSSSSVAPSTHQQQQQPVLTGLGLSGTNTNLGAATSNPAGSPPPHPPLTHQLHAQHQPQLQSQHQHPQHQLRIPAPTTASRAALSLSIQDPIAAAFQPDPAIDFAEAAQCVFTLRLFMQQQRFSQNQMDQLHAIYLTLDVKRKERLHLQQAQTQGGGQEFPQHFGFPGVFILDAFLHHVLTEVPVFLVTFTFLIQLSDAPRTSVALVAPVYTVDGLNKRHF